MSVFNDIDGLVLATIVYQSNIDVFSWIGFILRIKQGLYRTIK